MKLKTVFAAVLALAIVAGVAYYISASGANGGAAQEGEKIARSFLLNSDTFRFDGIAETVELVEKETPASGGQEFTFTFQTAHSGHGDRGELVILPVITEHRMVIAVENGRVTGALCCDGWDELAGEYTGGEGALTAEGEFVGLADSHTAEIIIDGEPRAFGLAEDIDFTGFEEGDAVRITYQAPEDGRPVIVAVEKLP